MEHPHRGHLAQLKQNPVWLEVERHLLARRDQFREARPTKELVTNTIIMAKGDLIRDLIGEINAIFEKARNNDKEEIE